MTARPEILTPGHGTPTRPTRPDAGINVLAGALMFWVITVTQLALPLALGVSS